jgi:hypothetical protein
MSKEAMKLAREWYDSGNENSDDFDSMIKQVIALAEQPAQQQEPEWYHFVSRGEDCFVPYKGQAPADATRLYTAPQPAQRKPLTDDQKDAARYQHIKGMARAMSLDINGNHYWTVALYGIRGPSLDEAIDRAIKDAHGIKENT